MRVPLRLLLLLSSLCLPARAQQAIHTEAAMTPSPGAIFLRQSFQSLSLGDDPTGFHHRITQFSSTTYVAYGLTKNLALTLNIPVAYRDVDGGPPDPTTGGGGGGGHGHGGPAPGTEGDHQLGSTFALDDITAGAKLRVFEKDFGPIDTARLSLIAAVEMPTGDSDFSSESWDPILGAVFSYVGGRHGFNADLRWKFNLGEHDQPVLPAMGDADALFYNLAYLYRVYPDTYAAGSHQAWYAILETNGLYETNGDHELLIAPGVMYEARNWALELSVQLPLWQQIDHRPQTEFTITFAVRLLL